MKKTYGIVVFAVVVTGIFLGVQYFFKDDLRVKSVHASLFEYFREFPNKIPLRSTNTYESTLKSLRFEYYPESIVHEDNDTITIRNDGFGYADQSPKDLEASSIKIRVHENPYHLSPRLWWFLDAVHKRRLTDIVIGTQRHFLTLNDSQQVYMVIPRVFTGDGRPLSSYVTCGNAMCEVQSVLSPMYSSELEYRAVLSSLQSYHKSLSSIELDSGQFYTNTRFGYTLWYPREAVPIQAPERNVSASDDDPFVDLGYLHIRALACTFSIQDRLLEQYISSGLNDSMVTRTIKTTSFTGDQPMEMISKLELSGNPTSTTYLSNDEYSYFPLKYIKSVYIKRGKLLYILSLPMNSSTEIYGKYSEDLFDFGVNSFRTIPLEDESNMSSLDACKLEKIGETDFYRNNYVVQFSQSGKFSDQYRLRGVHAMTFKTLNEYYGEDGEAAFYKNKRFSADLKTFVVLNQYYTKDEKTVYFTGEPIYGSDPKTFKVDQKNSLVGRDKFTAYKNGHDVRFPEQVAPVGL